MPSIIPGFEYDIFISYRQKDNKGDRWVTQFVNALKSELETTFKEDISIYFDENPYDGLLETHNVDKSLEAKLKCFIFIPIISQTYCDPKSFAWQHEFSAFIQLAKEDSFGRDIKLGNGNVASRILPIKIHELDNEDKALLESQLGGVLRAVEFIYKEPGVNRPLKPVDQRSDNQNKTDYRNQVNKIANAIKEITNSALKPSTSGFIRNPVLTSLPESISKPSVAVLPLTNLSHDPEQEYFSDGITENIIAELASNKGLRIISRTSIMRYKKTTLSAQEIATELNVQFILEGGVQASGKKVRINMQLLDVDKDDLTWSKVFVENLDDIFEIQSHVAEVVARELRGSLIASPEAKEEKIPTRNLEAYNLFLKGRHAFNQWNVGGYKLATDYFKKAIALDPEFQMAYSCLASSFSARMSWNGDLSPHEALLSIEKFLTEAWKRGPTENDYLTKAFVEFFIHKDFLKADQFLRQAIDLNVNDSNALYTHSYLLNMMGRYDEALQSVEKAKLIDPLTIPYFNYQAICFYLKGEWENALSILDEALRLYPGVLRFYDFKARLFLAAHQWTEAERTVLDGFRLSADRPPSMVAFQAIASQNLGNSAISQELLDELIKRSLANEKGVHIYIVYVYTAASDYGSALQWFEKALKTNDVDLIWKDVDPLLKGFRESTNKTGFNRQSKPDFQGFEKHILDLLRNKMPNLPYHNVDHIQDVVAAAMEIAGHEQVGEEEKNLIRLAAWLHDAGFIHSAKEHEVKGAAMAKELLPAFGFGEREITLICNMILATKLPQSPSTPLEKILCDADLDYLGRKDFPELSQKLFQEMLASGTVETEREWNLVQRTFLQSHRYHTRYSQSNREQHKQERLQEIILTLSKNMNSSKDI